jgi:hypothetical protein
MQQPSSQGSCQKLILMPFPTTMTVEAQKNALETSSSRMGNKDQGHCLSVLWSQSHLRQSAIPWNLGSGKPRPPSRIGCCTLLQATKHLPFCTISIPVHRNPFMIISRALCIHPGRPILIETYTSMAANVLLISANRLLWCMSCPFQAGSLSTTLSTMGCSVDLGNLCTDRGIPRYLTGN